MPFKSEKQRKWMHTNDPEMAKKWEKEEKKMKKETKVRSLIRKMVREIMNEDFAGSYPEHKRKSFDKKRQKQSEVLGYKLMGTPDVKTEIDDATKHSNSIDEAVSKEKVDVEIVAKKMERNKSTFFGKAWANAIRKHYKKGVSHYDLEKDLPDYIEGRAISQLFEAKKRDYKAEYKKYGSSTKSKKYRAELNKYNRQKGTYGNGDGKDASHKGGKIVGFEKESVNRGRAEKSRLKKEGKLNEKMDKKKAAVLLKQLGGNKFIAMTGAKGFAFSDKYMSFKIGRNSKGINFVRIGHNAKDLYDMEFGFVSVKGIKVKKKVNDVYADMLGTIFTKYTGMNVRL